MKNILKGQSLTEYILILVLLILLSTYFISHFDFNAIKSGVTFNIIKNNTQGGENIIPPMTP